MTKAIGVIPARLGSTRLSEKVLREIHGRPMIQYVWERASQAKGLNEVIIACDDAKIQEAASGFGAKAILTDKNHPNGTSRIGEVADQTEGDIFINIQGDEPTIDPKAIDQLVEVLRGDDALQVATLCVKKTDLADYQDPNVVKVVVDEKGNALYFSRSSLPYNRSGDESDFSYLKHLGIYGYKKSFLKEFVSWPSTRLEEREKLEQLRILENGIKIRVLETEHDSLGVDTEEDLKLAEKIINPVK